VGVGVLVALVVILVVAADEGGDGSGSLPSGGDERVTAEGETASAAGATATVLRTEGGLEPAADVFAPEEAYVGAEVRVCGAPADVALPWTARTEADVLAPVPLPPDALAGDHPPFDQVAGPGDDGCAQGWVVWDLPAGDAVARWDGEPSVAWLLPAG